ncbi:MAG: deoxyribodipyrimidine photo-lyase [Verrucomicrobiota bacterium]
MSRAIHWFRRDLRLSDNTALRAAADAHTEVIPVYIVSQWKNAHRWTGPLRQQFLCDSLKKLSLSLESIGSHLLIRQGNALDALEALVRETGADAIYTNRDPDPFGQSVETQLETLARRLNVRLHLFKDVALHERDEVLTGSQTPFRVFTPYSKAWAKLEKPSPVRPVTRLLTPEFPSLPLPTLATWGLSNPANEPLIGGESAALKRLDDFLERRILAYANTRDLPAEDGTSRISQDLRFGLISIRQVYASVQSRTQNITLEQRRSIQTFINELCWREFYFQVLWHNPQILEHEFSLPFRNLPWRSSPGAFDSWTRGETGFPIVDAGMRQLQQTGFMHNRVRMIVAMFLTKDLHLDWRQGEQWFMQNLLDGEISSNNGGWQWSAGTGTDAAPYFRIQNPWTQTERYDPDAAYIKRWIPELAGIPAVRLKTPPSPGLKLVPSYPLPMVDHQRERDIALAVYKQHLDVSRAP